MYSTVESDCKRARTGPHLEGSEHTFVQDTCDCLVAESEVLVEGVVPLCDLLERDSGDQPRDNGDCSVVSEHSKERDVNHAHGECKFHLEIPDFGEVAYIRSARYNELASKIERNGNRAILVDLLVDALDILQSFDVIEVEPATRQMLQHFHSSDYVSALENHHLLSERQLAKFGLIDDCPVFDELFELVCLGKKVQPDFTKPFLTILLPAEAGGSLQAAQVLCDGSHRTCIWWGGGRHHASAARASGFCYVCARPPAPAARQAGQGTDLPYQRTPPNAMLAHELSSPPRAASEALPCSTPPRIPGEPP